MTPRIVWLETGAPRKPAAGAACNGCGVCCAAEPCPLGVLLSRRRHGACVALRWQEGERRYRCAAVTDAPRWAQALARRWIAAQSGCDSDLEPRAASR